MSTVLVTGSAGFIGGYVVDELLRRGHEVIGLDNLSKYGRVVRSYEGNSHDVQRRVPSIDKARDVLGFEATTTLDAMLDEVVPWIAHAVEDGLI